MMSLISDAAENSIEPRMYEMILNEIKKRGYQITSPDQLSRQDSCYQGNIPEVFDYLVKTLAIKEITCDTLIH